MSFNSKYTIAQNKLNVYSSIRFDNGGLSVPIVTRPWKPLLSGLREIDEDARLFEFINGFVRNKHWNNEYDAIWK